MVQRLYKKAYYKLTTLCCFGGEGDGNAFSGEFEKK